MSVIPTDRPGVSFYTACPPSSAVEPADYLQAIADVAIWSERCGCAGALVYADNAQIDPWLVAQVLIEHTESFRPLIAVQPVYLHPYSVAKLVTSLNHLHGRSVDLNVVAGGFANDLKALNDPTPHDLRYERLVEYTTIVMRLLEGREPVTFDGRFYSVERLKLSPPLPATRMPAIFVSGSSSAGQEAARTLGATAVRYADPAAAAPSADAGTARCGLRLGILARPTEREAWRAARERFPEDRRGQLTHQMAMKVSDSVWHRQLSERPGAESDSPYWLAPFHNYKTMCPYLVGSYEVVASELARHLGRGCDTFILDVPASAEDLEHTMRACGQALETVGS